MFTISHDFQALEGYSGFGTWAGLTVQGREASIDWILTALKVISKFMCQSVAGIDEFQRLATGISTQHRCMAPSMPSVKQSGKVGYLGSNSL